MISMKLGCAVVFGETIVQPPFFLIKFPGFFSRDILYHLLFIGYGNKDDLIAVTYKKIKDLLLLLSHAIQPEC